MLGHISNCATAASFQTLSIALFIISCNTTKALLNKSQINKHIPKNIAAL
jgi:hypothetical protein